MLGNRRLMPRRYSPRQTAGGSFTFLKSMLTSSLRKENFCSAWHLCACFREDSLCEVRTRNRGKRSHEEKRFKEFASHPSNHASRPCSAHQTPRTSNWPPLHCTVSSLWHHSVVVKRHAMSSAHFNLKRVAMTVSSAAGSRVYHHRGSS
jgi:hypothetical protein